MQIERVSDTEKYLSFSLGSGTGFGSGGAVQTADVCSTFSEAAKHNGDTNLRRPVTWVARVRYKPPNAMLVNLPDTSYCIQNWLNPHEGSFGKP